MLSGPDSQELKLVKQAIKTCLKTARILLLERELLGVGAVLPLRLVHVTVRAPANLQIKG